MGARILSPAQPTGPMLFADEGGSVEPMGDLMLLTIAGQRVVMSRHHLLTLMELGRRAIIKQATDAATVHDLKRSAPSPRRPRGAGQQREGR